MNNSILFIVDHKHRDLPSLSLIGYHLEKKFNRKVLYCGTSFEKETIQEEDPKFIVIPKLNYSIKNQLKWKLQRRKIIIVEAEGNMQNDDRKTKITVYPDLYIFWNDKTKNLYSKKLSKYNTKILVEGYYRSDFFTAPLKNIYDRNKIKLDLGIHNNKKIVTFATSTQDAHLNKKIYKEKEKKITNNYEGGATFKTAINSLLIQKKVTEQFLFNFQNEFGDKVNCVIKPHPNESVIYWHNLICTHRLTSCYLMAGKNINELLSISDFHISHGVCTTTVEAMLYGLETLELVTPLSKQIYSEDHLQLPNYQCESSDEMIKITKKVLSKKSKIYLNDRLYDYTKKYFKKVDGQTSYRYAIKINNYIESSNHYDQRVKLKLILKYTLLLFARMTKKTLLYYKYKKNDKIIKEVNVRAHLGKVNNTKDYYEINGVNIHKEYGLYDNKIKTDDHRNWYKKFEELGV